MPKKDIRGFTILEIMIVVILMGIIGTATIPSIGLIRKQEVKKLAKEMCLDLTAQRMHAMAGGKKASDIEGEIESKIAYSLKLVGDSEIGPYYSYELEPSFDTASGQKRQQNKDNSRNIHITMEVLYMKVTDDEDEEEVIKTIQDVQFDSYGYILNKDASSSVGIDKLTIKITYDSAEAVVVFNGVTGHYSIN